jgi:hypothetical protein
MKWPKERNALWGKQAAVYNRIWITAVSSSVPSVPTPTGTFMTICDDLATEAPKSAEHYAISGRIVSGTSVLDVSTFTKEVTVQVRVRVRRKSKDIKDGID